MVRYLMATDLSLRSDAALGRALAVIDSQKDAELTVLHVDDDCSDWGASGAKVQALEDALESELQRMGQIDRARIQLAVTSGDPDLAIHDRAEALEAQLVFIGIPRARRFPERLAGTTAERFLNISDRPIAVIRDPDSRRQWRHVLFALDEDPRSLAVFDRIATLGLLQDTVVTVLHATNLPEPSMIRAGRTTLVDMQRLDLLALSEIEQNLRARLAARLQGASEVHFVVRHGAPIAAIRQHIDDGIYDVLLLGSRGRGPFMNSLLGSTSAEMIRNADIDLICVPLRGVEDAPPAD